MKSINMWGTLKWISTACLMFGTISMLSPTIAAQSIFPWTLYLFGNGIWLLDSFRIKNWPWVYLSLFFVCWNVLLIFSRWSIIDIQYYISPIITTMEKFLLI